MICVFFFGGPEGWSDCTLLEAKGKKDEVIKKSFRKPMNEMFCGKKNLVKQSVREILKKGHLEGKNWPILLL